MISMKILHGTTMKYVFIGIQSVVHFILLEIFLYESHA